ncbi:hypothetical protein APHAL10511_006835 [Amanita phalloides]|nr:hypothetical protein APHAL10511_006835 [Amanita phalloides]
MVRSIRTTIFILLATIASVVLTFPLQSRNVSQLEQDIEDFSGDLIGLDYAVSSYGSTRFRPKAIDISGKFDLTLNGLQQCVNDINRIRGTRITTADAQIVLKLVEAFKPTILHTLATVRSKKGVFKKLHMIPFILGQVKDLCRGVTALMEGLVSVVPSQFQGEATVVQQKFGVAFLETFLAYH